MDYQLFMNLEDLESEMRRFAKVLKNTQNSIVHTGCLVHDWERCKILNKMVCKVCGKHGIRQTQKRVRFCLQTS